METRIAVATDGTDAASGALHIAEVLSHRHGAAVEVISVLEPIPIDGAVYAEAAGLAVAQLNGAARAALQARVRSRRLPSERTRSKAS
jgi:nucleotide-binding universal stress UspA family protein